MYNITKKYLQCKCNAQHFSVSSNIDCHFKTEDKKKKSHRTCDKIDFIKKNLNQDGQMGRVKSITPLVCKHSHFKYEERLQLEFYLYGKGKYPKITSHVLLGTLLNKHPRTIAREIKRGQIVSVK